MIFSGKVDVVGRFAELQMLMLVISRRLTEQQADAIDQQFVPRQRALMQALAACQSDAKPMWDLEVLDANLPSSASLQEWLGILELSRHLHAVREWCDQQGAACLAEMLDYREDLAAALSDLSQSERDRLLCPPAAEAAINVIMRMQTCDLERMLLIVASRITNGQWQEIEVDIDPHGQVALIARLHALKAVATRAASRVVNWKKDNNHRRLIPTHDEDCKLSSNTQQSRVIARQDEKLIDSAKHWASKDLCQSFGYTSTHGRLNQGTLYRSDCWSACGPTCTHGRLNQGALRCSDCWSVWEN